MLKFQEILVMSVKERWGEGEGRNGDGEVYGNYNQRERGEARELGERTEEMP